MVLYSIAIEFGDFRLTALAILKAVAVTGVLFVGARLVSQTVGARIKAIEDI